MSRKGPSSRNVADYYDEFIKLVAKETPEPPAASSVNVVDEKVKNAFNGLETSTFTVCTRIRPVLDMDQPGSGENYACIFPGAVKAGGVDHTEAALVLTPRVTITGKAKLEPASFDFDYTFGPEVGAADLFSRVGRPLVQRALAGQIGVVFAYGQTGSGKTHTMGALMDELVAEIFQQGAPHREVTFSYLEIAGQVCTDCLDLQAAPGGVKIGEMLDGRMEVKNLCQVACASAPDFLQQVARAKSMRATEATERNATSSRSHGVAIVRIGAEAVQGALQPQAGLLYVIDLAGSERMADSKGHTDKRMEETKAINVSLMALKECIRARTLAGAGDGSSEVFVPYRRSKLTLLMKDVFDISCRRLCSTVVLAHVSPLARDVKHSTSTLQYSAPLRVSVRRQTAKSYQRDERDPALWSHEQLCEWVAQTSPDPRVLGGSLVAQGDGGLVLCMVNEAEFFKRVRAVLAPSSPEEEASAGAAAQALYSTLWTLICDAKVRRRRPNGSIITAEEEAAEIAEIARRGEEKAALWKEREAHMKSDLVGYDGKPL